MCKFDDVTRAWDENPVDLKRSIAITAIKEEMLPVFLITASKQTINESSRTDRQ